MTDTTSTHASLTTQPPGLVQRQPVVLGMPSSELSEDQRLDALKRIQSQAENRVKLGMQLFKSAEARLSAQADLARTLRAEHASLAERVDHRLDALADELKSLRAHSPSQTANAATAHLLRRLDELESQLAATRDSLANLRQEHRQALDELRREHRTQQNHTQQVCEKLLRRAEVLFAATEANTPPTTAPPAAPNQPSSPTASPPTTSIEPAKPLAPIPVPPSAHLANAPNPSRTETPTTGSSHTDNAAASPPPQPSDEDAHIYTSILDRLRHTQQQHIPDTLPDPPSQAA